MKKRSFLSGLPALRRVVPIFCSLTRSDHLHKRASRSRSLSAYIVGGNYTLTHLASIFIPVCGESGAPPLPVIGVDEANVSELVAFMPG